MCGSNNYFGLSFHPDGHRRRSRGARARRRRHDRLARGQRHLCRRTAGSSRRSPSSTASATRWSSRPAIRPTSALISGLCGPDDTVLLDIESHASIYDGARLSGAQHVRVPPQLRRRSARASWRRLPRSRPLPGGRRRAVFDQRRRRAARRDRRRLPRRRARMLMVDEAHSFGAYGARGLGCAEAQGVLDRVDFIVGTFSKTLAGVGGFCVSNHAALKLLHFAARPYVFTASGVAGEHRRRRSRAAGPAARRRAAAAAVGQRAPRPRRADAAGFEIGADRIADRAGRDRHGRAGGRSCGGRCSTPAST